LKSGKSLSSLVVEAELQNKYNRSYWKWIKKVKLMPKVEVFWWRLYSNAIPTNHFLFSRRLQENFTCSRGCNEVEDIDHVTTRCEKLR